MIFLMMFSGIATIAWAQVVDTFPVYTPSQVDYYIRRVGEKDTTLVLSFSLPGFDKKKTSPSSALML